MKIDHIGCLIIVIAMLAVCGAFYGLILGAAHLGAWWVS